MEARGPPDVPGAPYPPATLCRAATLPLATDILPLPETLSGDGEVLDIFVTLRDRGALQLVARQVCHTVN